MVSITTENATFNMRMEQEIKSISPTFYSKAQAIGCMAQKIHLEARDGINALAINGTSTSTQMKISKEAFPMDIVSLADPPNGIDINYDSIVFQITKLAFYRNQITQRCERFMATAKLIYDKENPRSAVILL
ncbi:hypothetical protein O181_120042 [Austropuccinia psidii MF-1]|uniref:Uncharacterized protein n=1 Tax=Austropuccinia psidii MF-1 TaxID=1389203 RepID=A0A9Q3Q210_9BASI|nr:hypothetical protein [Austropuccinia psidii MF-1]